MKVSPRASIFVGVPRFWSTSNGLQRLADGRTYLAFANAKSDGEQFIELIRPSWAQLFLNPAECPKSCFGQNVQPADHRGDNERKKKCLRDHGAPTHNKQQVSCPCDLMFLGEAS
jgi:hypothetical protein